MMLLNSNELNENVKLIPSDVVNVFMKKSVDEAYGLVDDVDVKNIANALYIAHILGFSVGVSFAKQQN